MPLRLNFLPAAEGDAIWVRWGDALEHQLMVDMGQERTGPAIRARIEELPPDMRHFDLLVITHVDGDHIGGVLSGLAEAPPLEGWVFDDVWFNGWPHLRGLKVRRPGDDGGPQPMGPAQGQRLTSWLTGPWNEEFARGPVVRSNPLRVAERADGLSLTVLGPTQASLQALQPSWEREVEKAITKGSLPAEQGLQSMGRSKPTRPELTDATMLKALADAYAPQDSSPSNATSIVLMLEWRGRKVLLTGDAYGADVVTGLRRYGSRPVEVDVVKLPHHSSVKNVTSELVKSLRSPVWVISTDGGTHYHPDAAAIARVLVDAESPRLAFNVPSEFNGWWSDPSWMDTFDYTVETGTKEHGLTITMEPRPPTP